MSEEEGAVWLSPLKFAKPFANSQPSTATNCTLAQPDPNQNQSAFSPTSSGAGRSKLYETLATETMAEDLAPNSGIWQKYLEAAKEHDGEMVKGQNDNLDMMLLFAALFSAILSAFLIESKNMLQQDPADISIALLLSIAQSQQRIEQGAPQMGSAPIELPSFSAPLSVRWVNGLWFFALALSLSAALIAMLAKEWLTAFTASRPRTAHAYTLLHQARLIGLTNWHALSIIGLLPSLLHLAVLLFSLGLVLYLWTLDSSIAAVVAVVVGVTMLFYAATAFAAAIYESCPFVTQISKHIQQGLRKYAPEWMKEREPAPGGHDEHTTDEEQRALIWLIGNLRDTDAVDYAYMCLTGLRLRKSNHTIGNIDEADVGSRPAAPAGRGQAFNRIVHLILGKGTKKPDVQHTPLHQLFGGLCDRLFYASFRYPRELAECEGVTVARYACALPQMVECLQLSYNNKPVGQSTKSGYDRTKDEHPAIGSFTALDAVWSDEYPALSADSYALLTSAELQLTMAAVPTDLKLATSQPTAPGTTSPEALLPTRTGAPEIPMTCARIVSDEYPVSLFDLRARYSRALSRATCLLRYHGDGNVSIGTGALIHLLGSVQAAAQCNQLNTESHMSTEYPHSETGSCPDVSVWVVPFQDDFHLKPKSVGDFNGLLVGLLRLLDPAGAPMHHSLKRAVTGTLGAVAPILLKQWLKVTLPHEERNVSEHRELSAEFFVNWPLAEDYNNVDRVHPILPQIVMHLAVFAVSHSGCYGIDALPKEAILALRRRFLAAPILFAKAFKSNANHEINRLICSVDFNSERLGHDVLKSLIDMFSLKPKNRTLFRFPGISAASVAPFLRILDQASCEGSELQTLLDALAHFSPTDGYSLQGLEISEDIFGELLKIGERDEYRWVVAKCILRIIETAASRPSSQKIEARAVVGTFDAVAFALGALPFDQGRAKLLASTCELLTLSTRPTHTITTCPAVTNLRHSLQSINMKKEQHEHERTKLEEMLSWWVDGLPVESQGPFFEHSKAVEGEL